MESESLAPTCLGRSHGPRDSIQGLSAELVPGGWKLLSSSNPREEVRVLGILALGLSSTQSMGAQFHFIRGGKTRPLEEMGCGEAALVFFPTRKAESKTVRSFSQWSSLRVLVRAGSLSFYKLTQ